MPLSQQAQGVIGAFDGAGVTPEHRRHLRQAIEASPALIQTINSLVAQGNLRRITPPGNPYVSMYAPFERAMHLPLVALETPPGSSFNGGMAIFLLGRELCHGLERDAMAQARERFDHELIAVGNSPMREHDYTRPIENQLRAIRAHEAAAEIAGWNALVSAVRADGSPPALGDIYARAPDFMKHFIDVDHGQAMPTCSLKTNLEVDRRSLHMARTALNLEGMARNYFDSRPDREADSPYYWYAAEAIGRAIHWERHCRLPRANMPMRVMSIDMAKLQLDPALVAQTGIDLGDNTLPVPYLDKSTKPPTYAEFRHAALHGSRPPATHRLDDLSHPGHALYRQALDAMHQLDVQIGRRPDDRSGNLAAALTVVAKRGGMHEITHVFPSSDGRITYAVQRDQRSMSPRYAQVDTARSTYTTVEESSRQWQQVAQQRTPSTSTSTSRPEQSSTSHRRTGDSAAAPRLSARETPMPLTPQAKALIDAFGHEPGVTPEHRRHLRHAIASSPVLTDEFNALVARGDLRQIVPLSNLRATSFYVPLQRKLCLPLEALRTPHDGGSFSSTVVYALGREVRLALDAPDLERWQEYFNEQLAAIANSPGTEHDYTFAIENHLAVLREYDAVAEIAGWNAVTSAVRHEIDGLPSLQNIFRRCIHMRNFIDVDSTRDPPDYSLKPGLRTGIDSLHIPAFPWNIEVLAKHHVDPSTDLQEHAAEAIGRAVRCERYYNSQRPTLQPRVMSVDIARLRLDARSMAQCGIDLGSNTLPMPYLDKSSWPPAYAEFLHTAPGQTGQPALPSLDQPCHPDHALYRQARAAVHALDSRIGRTPDRRSDNLAAALTVSARRDGLEEIDHIVQDTDGSQTYGQQRHGCTSLMRVTSVDTARSTYTPVEESSLQWRQLMQQRESPRPRLEQQRQQLPRLHRT